MKWSIGAIVLAAGASTRLGKPKQLMTVHGEERLLERAVRIALEAGCTPVIVVLGAHALEIQATCRLGEAQVVLNPDWVEGMGSSVRIGIGGLAKYDRLRGVVLLACDQPAITVAHLHALMAVSEETTASAYAGRRGVPAYFPASWSERLLRLTGDQGARDLLRDARTVELAGGEVDVDTPEALTEARQIYGKR